VNFATKFIFHVSAQIFITNFAKQTLVRTNVGGGKVDYLENCRHSARSCRRCCCSSEMTGKVLNQFYLYKYYNFLCSLNSKCFICEREIQSFASISTVNSCERSIQFNLHNNKQHNTKKALLRHKIKLIRYYTTNIIYSQFSLTQLPCRAEN